ncbi:hypothetical protein SLNWT_4115 [Streptomyces albus]|uniref:Uncharacterized protein n=1 Tax=Streptomyces albus (strain ATCC 21838 / DSM 41398 / FERM P-419 / JCM 4703 / NBRC 107858) TaxID=1081613 RepID=A0A0B5F0U2_STRA4|nr:hypothetical protein SLNWT_4115 [Streptomyces albus]AOU78801.1 hypothetical protein SLNHY_4110 [Streptomyces albus]AYN34537.1 hypothetical protein DUI70_4036 [Streptomyces albus]
MLPDTVLPGVLLCSRRPSWFRRPRVLSDAALPGVPPADPAVVRRAFGRLPR